MSNFFQVARESVPWTRIVFLHRDNTDLNSTFTWKATNCNFQCGSSIGVPSNATFWFRRFSVSWPNLVKVYSRQTTELRTLQYLSSWKDCPISTVVRRNPASAQNSITRSCCDNFSIHSFSTLLQEKIFANTVITIPKHFCLDHAWHEWNLIALPQRVPNSTTVVKSIG